MESNKLIPLYRKTPYDIITYIGQRKKELICFLDEKQKQFIIIHQCLITMILQIWYSKK